MVSRRTWFFQAASPAFHAEHQPRGLEPLSLPRASRASDSQMYACQLRKPTVACELPRAVQFRSCDIFISPYITDPPCLLRPMIQRVLFQRLLHTQQRLVVGDDVCHATGEPVQEAKVRVRVAVTGRGVTTAFVETTQQQEWELQTTRGPQQEIRKMDSAFSSILTKEASRKGLLLLFSPKGSEQSSNPPSFKFLAFRAPGQLLRSPPIVRQPLVHHLLDVGKNLPAQSFSCGIPFDSDLADPRPGTFRHHSGPLSSQT